MLWEYLFPTQESTQDDVAGSGRNIRKQNQFSLCTETIVVIVTRREMLAGRGRRLRPLIAKRRLWLMDPEMASQFRFELRNHFEALAQEEDNSVRGHWDRFRRKVVNGAAASIGRRRGTFRERWIQRDTGDLIDERNKVKQVCYKSWMQWTCVIG